MMRLALALSVLLCTVTPADAQVGTSRLDFADSGSVRLAVGVIPLLVSGTWTTRVIGAAVYGTNEGLAPSTTYYVYASDSSGSTVLGFSVTGHTTTVTDTMAVEVKAGAATSTLVGMVQTNSSSQFQVDASHLWVLSWFSRRELAGHNQFTANRTSSSVTPVEINSEIRINALTWADELVVVDIITSGLSATGTSNWWTGVGIDSTTAYYSVTGAISVAGAGTVTVMSEFLGNLWYWSPAYLALTNVAEGNHFFTLIGFANTGGGFSATWASGVGYTLTVVVRG